MTTRKRWSLATFGIVCGISVVGLLLDFRCACAFENLQQAHESITRVGYHCVGDREDGQLQYSFVVSRMPITRADVVGMRKVGAMGSTWKGRIWIVAPSSDVPLLTAPGEVPPRVWGRVLAFGDADLLDEIEGRHGWCRFFDR